MKTAAKVGASVITVTTAAIVLLLDSNWVAFGILSVAFVGIMGWVYRYFRQATRV